MIPLQAMPQKKPAYPSVEMGNHVYIAGFGKITRYENDSGAVGRLLELMDGTRTVMEIAATLSREFAEISPEMVVEAITDMDRDGFLEDRSLSGAGILDAYALERYHRNINFFSTYASMNQNKYELQRQVMDTRVCILGLGGLGSHIVYDLAGIGIGRIRAVEFDTVELSNLNRQILYTEADVGSSKANLAEQRIRAFNPRIDFHTVQKRLGSAEDVLEVITGYQYVILVADRPKTLIARWANAACVRAGIPLLAGGLEAQRGLHYTVIPGVTGCIECWINHVQNSDPISYAILEKRRQLNITGDNTAFAPLVSVVTGMLNAELIRLITGIRPSVAAGRLITIDFDTMTTGVRETWERNPDCAVCKGLTAKGA